LRRKHQDAIQEMSEQIDQLQKMKAKIEKDKSHIIAEIADARAATDEVVRAQASADKSNRNLLTSLNEINKRVGEANLTLGDFEASKRKIAALVRDLFFSANSAILNMRLMEPRRPLMKNHLPGIMFSVKLLKLKVMPICGEPSMKVKLLPRLRSLR